MATRDELIRKRDVVISKIARLDKYLNAINIATLDQFQLQVKLKRLEENSLEFSSVQDEIDQHCTDDPSLQSEFQQRIKYDEQIDVLTVKFMKLIKPQKGTRGLTTTEFKLPKIELPTFDGTLQNWASFRDIFSAAVHTTSLAKSQKLTYLKSKLLGEAAQLVKSFDLTDANYDVAWSMLNDRYDNNRELLFSILKRFVGQPQLSGHSASALRSLIDVSHECVESLKRLNVSVEHWGAILMFHMFQKLDQVTKELWEQKLPDSSIPTLKTFIDFLEQRARGLAATASNSNRNQGGRGEPNHPKKVNVHHVQPLNSCQVCEGDHPMYRCTKFIEMPVPQRFDFVKKASLCLNCLRRGHSATHCNSNSTCKTCNSKHNTMLHFEKPISSESKPKEEKADQKGTINVHHSADESGISQSILATAVVKVKDFHGQQHSLRAILDGGSTSSFVTEDVVRRLGLMRSHNSTQLYGIASTPMGKTKGITILKVSPHFESYMEPYHVQCFILPRVTGRLPSQVLDRAAWPHLQGLNLADPNFHKPSAVDILLGSDFFWNSIQDGKIQGPDHAPVGINSSLGWLIAGNTSHVSTSINAHISTVDLDQRLQQFWAIESISTTTRTFTKEETLCESHFESTHSRNEEGRYIVKLPFKDPQPVLGASRELAVRRFKQLERRLPKQPVYHKQYQQFMKEYLEMGHMELIPEIEIQNPLNPTCYIPHHFVLKESSSTTKFRVVFDASMQTSSGVSLNQSLMVGPTIQETLLDILMRFRKHAIAFTADVAKMYRQVLVTSSDADMQRIVWRADPNEPMLDYRLVTVTYGTASAPYLATKALQQLAKDEGKSYPLAKSIVENDFYVDDLMSGASTIKEAMKIQKQLQQLTIKGCMDLRKWCSNSPEFMESIPPEFRETKFYLPLDCDQNVKALGIIWNMTTDDFMFKLNIDTATHDFQLTKRKLLSEISKIFDPLGWLAPIIIRAKILLQDLWKLELGWDDILPENIQQQWYTFRDNLHHVEQLRINRCMLPSTYIQVSLVGFSDASEKAYASVVYTCAYFNNRDPIISLVSSKTRVAPVKQISIPRLELCGALLLVQLMNSTIKSLRVKFHNLSCWTDSTVVLAWLKAHPSKWNTFVANRVTDVIDTFPSKYWGHVSGVDNPADCASRGLDPSDLQVHDLWWTGPKWLCNGKPSYTNENPDWTAVNLEEKKQKPVIMISTPPEPNQLWSKFSSLRKLNRVTAWVLRFIQICFLKTQQTKGISTSIPGGLLTVTELTNSLHKLIGIAQHEIFPIEIHCLNAKQPLPNKSRILPLAPFLDTSGLLRVGGRLRHAQIPVNQKNPILLPKHHQITEMIIEQYHLDLFHAGAQLLLSTIQHQFWIPCGRDVIRHRIKKCVICTRHSATTMQNLMGDLPEARVNPSRPFSKCGVDYAGPFLIKPISTRSKITLKAYLSLFVCFVTHAVHLEVVTSLSTDAFLAAFKRFVSRRGLPTDMHSDCGTNFVGAARELKETQAFFNSSSHNNKVITEMSANGTTWHFNPPGAPHFGGLWEAGVKSVKFHLHRIVGSTRLNFEELTTIMAQIEAILNSRPLTPVSTDPHDLSALTPGHFLIGAPLSSVPERDLSAENPNRLNRWQMIQLFQQQFWHRWTSEYISRLQQRPKWLQQRKDIRCDDLVIIKDDRYPPLQWKLGRVISIHPGDDGITRVVTLRTADGEKIRSLVKLCLLPIDPSCDSENIESATSEP